MFVFGGTCRPGDHFESFISAQIESRRCGNASEVVRSGLRLLEEHESKVAALRQALEFGAASGDAGVLDFDSIRAEARKKVRGGKVRRLVHDRAAEADLFEIWV